MVHKHREILSNRNAIFSLCETSYGAQFRPDVTSLFVGWCIYENFRSLLPRPLSISSNWLLKVINASAAVTLLEQRPEKIQAPREFEPTTSAMPVQCSRNSELWKPHESGRMRVSPHWHRRGRGFESHSEPEFFQVSVLVVLLPHLH